MEKEKFIIVAWPEIQNLETKEGFEDNACLINDEPFLTKYGTGAYFVNEEWYKNITKN